MHLLFQSGYFDNFVNDNYTRQNAQALLGESRIHQIIMEVRNQYLKQNLILN